MRKRKIVHELGDFGKPKKGLSDAAIAAAAAAREAYGDRRKPASSVSLPESGTAAPLQGVERCNAILGERGASYGPVGLNQGVLGKAWTAILESHYQIKLPHDIPAHVASLMMVSLKQLRAANPFKFNQDNYDDGHNYLTIAEATYPHHRLLNGVRKDNPKKAD